MTATGPMPVQQSASAPPRRAAVTVIVPAWGVAGLIGDALASLQAQTRSDWDAIVIDDGDRRVAAALRPFAGDRRIRLLETSNGGVSAARNRGIAACSTPLVSMLDGDDRYRADCLEKMAGALDADPGLAFVTSDAAMFGDPSHAGLLFSTNHPQHGPLTLARALMREVNICGASMVRRGVMANVGGYDERLRAAEDLDLWFRILEQGGRGVCIPEPLIEYRRRPGSLSTSTRSLAQADVQAYRQAVERLAGRPEQAAARTMLAGAQNRLRIEDGLEAIAGGQIDRGLALLRTTDLSRRSAKWRAAMILFRLAPPLAGPVLRRYMRRHPFGTDASRSSA